MEIFISTGLLQNSSTINFAKKIKRNKINNIEFSSGKYDKDILRKIQKLNINSQIHNYFPVPKEPFVVNLASTNDAVYKKTFNHLKKAINFSKKINANYFTFHAGFLIDPNVKDFGKSLSGKIVNQHSKCLNIFVKRLINISEYAKKKNVRILIENNVLTKNTSKKFNKNPFLMSDYKDTKKIMKMCKGKVGLLVDVAHLKVSSKTLNFDPNKYLIKLNKFIKAYHLSDNNGLSDQNRNVKKNSWFWKHIKKDVDFFTLELKDLRILNLKNQIKLVKEKLERL